jgi:alpha-beta hydrolase superfamily lysophospholipase
VIVYGRSLGAALALVEACRRSDLTGVVAESPYVSQKLLKQHSEDTTLSARRRAIHLIDSPNLEPLADLKDFRAKNVLVLHGKSEHFIRSSEVAALVDAIPGDQKRFLDFDLCDHLELPSKDPQHFGEAMELFLKQCKL